MTEKFLGKITSAKFGTVKDYPFLMGLQLRFSFNGSSIGDGGKYTVNLSNHCNWENKNRSETIEKSIEFINKILEDAKCNYVNELINKPVELTIENNTFKDFRILTEVI